MGLCLVLPSFSAFVLLSSGIEITVDFIVAAFAYGETPRPGGSFSWESLMFQANVAVHLGFSYICI